MERFAWLIKTAWGKFNKTPAHRSPSFRLNQLVRHRRTAPKLIVDMVLTRWLPDPVPTFFYLFNPQSDNIGRNLQFWVQFCLFYHSSVKTW